MRGSRFVVPIAGALLLWPGSAAHASVPLAVRPIVDREVAAAHPDAAAIGRASNPAAIRAGIESHSRRWRSFRDDLAARGFNRAPYAALGRGATPPPRRASATEGATRPLGPGPERTLRVAFLRIDFSADRGGSQSSGDGHFDLTPTDTLQPSIDRPPHNRPFYQAHFQALSRYYEGQSYGLVHVEGEVWPRSRNGAYSISDMADLGPWKFSPDIYGAAVHMFRTMLFAADSQAKVMRDTIPWNDYDRIVIIHAGSDFQSDVRQDSPEDIPSFTLGVVDTDAVVFGDGSNASRPIDRAAFIPETVNQDGYFGAINGVLAHECGHLFFGFVDVYDTDRGLPTVGFWSLMDYGNGVGSIVQTPTGEEIYATGFLPPSVDPWQRFRFMLNDQVPVPEASYGDTMRITASAYHPDVRRVSLSSDEYLMLENRYVPLPDSIRVDQDDSTRVVLGPLKPDPRNWDVLLPGSGVLVWHVDESVFPFEFAFPIDTSLRVNPDFGLNSNPLRKGLSIIEGDALEDLGDLGSPYLLGAPFDPYFLSNNPSLSDSTAPNLIPHIGTRTHTRLDFLDDPDSTMRVSAARVWTLKGWPKVADFPPGGPLLLAVDADGDRKLEVCWAGGQDSLFVNNQRIANPDSAALFAVRPSGAGLDSTFAFAHLDRRPRPLMAAMPLGENVGGGAPPVGPSDFAVSTYASGPDTSSPGGRVWLIDRHGQALPGWPAPLESLVTTPPVIVRDVVYVGCSDGRVYALSLDGTTLGRTDPPLAGGISGRLAVTPLVNALSTSAAHGLASGVLVAAGGARGQVGVWSSTSGYQAVSGWPKQIGPTGFDPDFLWLDFGGSLNSSQDCFRGALSLVVHHADWLWAFCASGEPLSGWGRDVGDTLVGGLGAGDPDGDGFPEVLTQTITSRVGFYNRSGYPSPGWPRRGTPEDFRTESPAMAFDVDGDGRGEVIAMNSSGIIAALKLDGKPPLGWPLASGLGTAGAPVVADLDRNGSVEIVAPDRFGVLYGYSAPVPIAPRRSVAWGMVGGDAGRTSALLLDPGQIDPAPDPGTGPLVRGSLKVFPNPARRRPLSFAYQLTEPADVEFRILDVSGHQVAAFSRRGRQADNLEVWDPSGIPAGLYTARVRFRAAGADRTELLELGVLR